MVFAKLKKKKKISALIKISQQDIIFICTCKIQRGKRWRKARGHFGNADKHVEMCFPHMVKNKKNNKKNKM